MPDEVVVQQDDVKLLEAIPDGTEDKAEEEPVEGKEEGEEVIEDKEDEEEEGELKAKTDEEPEYHARPEYKAIKAKYPQLFKDFPGMRDVFFRERAYTDVFPTVEAAKAAAEDAESFGTIRTDVLNGDAETFIGAVKDVDGDAIGKFSTKFLPALYKADQQLYFKAVSPVLEDLVRNAYREGKAGGDENLTNAALKLSQFIFGDTNIALGTKSIRTEEKQEDDPERKKFEQEKKTFYTRQYQEFHGSVTSGIDSKLKAVILDGLDPDGVLEDELKEMLTERVMQKVGAALQSDVQHMAHMNSLWERAAKTGLGGESKSRIVSAYLARAKALVPSVRANIKSAALGTAARVAKHKQERGSENANKRDIPASGRSSSSLKSIDPKRVDWSKTSDSDLMDGKATLRS